MFGSTARQLTTTHKRHDHGGTSCVRYRIGTKPHSDSGSKPHQEVIASHQCTSKVSFVRDQDTEELSVLCLHEKKEMTETEVGKDLQSDS
eukprot:12932699-Prorocentrum_lima.AAC.1